MTGWQSSNRRGRLPANWDTIRAAVLHRDHNVCQIRGPRCTIIATEADHVHAGDDHTMTNLQAACTPCHRAKSSSEGGTAAAQRRRSMQRRTEPHPGLRRQ